MQLSKQMEFKDPKYAISVYSLLRSCLDWAYNVLRFLNFMKLIHRETCAHH